ncbi:MAG TPA: hypothetical protein DCE65_04425, partial [Clostridiales bacterium]|nr:hypothetical protein [Clostridiales bacterium]
YKSDSRFRTRFLFYYKIVIISRKIAKKIKINLNKNRFSCFRILFVNVLPFFTAAKTSAGTTHTARIRRAAYDTYGAQRREIL